MNPLAGRTVLVTRPKAQADGLAEELGALGAEVVLMPVIAIGPPESFDPLDDALRSLDSYDWVILTSVNGVKAVTARMSDLGLPVSSLASRRLAAIGPATAAELERTTRRPDLVPPEFVSEAIAESIKEFGGAKGMKILMARADIARKDLAHILRNEGATVDEVAAYRIIQEGSAENLPEASPDYITLTSSSAVRGALDILKANGRKHWMSDAYLASIGPITSATVRELGFQIAVEAKEYTVTGLVEALVEHAKKEPIHA